MSRMMKIIAVALVATSAMTLFSYLLSALLQANFREPELLEHVLLALKEPAAAILAWIIHYAVGFLFVIVYAYFWSVRKVAVMKSRVLLGFLSGLIAWLAWYLVLQARPDLPVANHIAYYIQLVAAHVVFGIAAGFVYRMSEWKA